MTDTRVTFASLDRDVAEARARYIAAAGAAAIPIILRQESEWTPVYARRFDLRSDNLPIHAVNGTPVR